MLYTYVRFIWTLLLGRKEKIVLHFPAILPLQSDCTLGTSKKVYAGQAGAHTGRSKAKPTSLLPLPSAMIAPIVMALVVGFLGWAYRALKPPPPKICGSPDGPPITSPRVKLSDGRHLAYRESGVPKEVAKYKIIAVHGYDSPKDLSLPLPQELIEELKIYILFFSRAGYGESDPYPSRSVKSEAFDIQELADQLQIGSKFYVFGVSLGAYPIWSCLKYIPHRLSGASMVVPFLNFWWPIFPANLSREAFRRLPSSYRTTLQIAHYTPWLFYWWMTQTWFPSLSTDQRAMFNDQDLEILKSFLETPIVDEEKIRQQGVYESLHRDILAGYGKWEFDLLDLNNPFPGNDSAVHIWQGYEDRIIPFKLTRYISEKLPWIRYHEVPDGGHLMILKSETCETILRALLLG